MKQQYLRFLSSIICLMLAGQLCAQTTTTCPAPNPGDPNCYQTSRPDGGNPLVNWPPLPHQDCCNAISLSNSLVSIGSDSLIPPGAPAGTLFPGCVQDELPNPDNTCFSNNEKGTTWFKFQIRPLKLSGAPTAPGSPAGKLRFKIIPKDVCSVPNYDEATDLGSSSYGNTDCDFLLFKIPASASSEGAACTVIRNSPTFGAPGSVIASCNWTGTRGPTGLFEPGTGTEFAQGSSTRFNKPLDVKVGDVFYLAVDNFSVNTLGFDLDFRGLFAVDDSTAKIAAEDPDTIGIKSVEAPYVCAAPRLRVKFNYPVPCDSVISGWINVASSLTPAINIVSIAPEDGCNSDGRDSVFMVDLNFMPSPDDPTLKLNLRKKIRSVCNTQYNFKPTSFRIKKFLTITKTRNLACNREKNLIVSAEIDGAYASTQAAQDSILYKWYDSGTGQELLNLTPHLGGLVIFNTSNGKSIKIFNPNPSFSQNKLYKIVARDLRNGCIDSTYAQVLFSGYQPRTDSICGGEPLMVNLDFLHGLGRYCDYKWSWRNYANGSIFSVDTILADTAEPDLFAGLPYDTLVLKYRHYADAVTDGCLYKLPFSRRADCSTAFQIIQQPSAFQTINTGEPVFFYVRTTNRNIPRQWQVDQGSGFNTISPLNADYSGANTDTLRIASTQLFMNNYIYRVRFVPPGSPIIYSTDGILIVLVSVSDEIQPSPLQVFPNPATAGRLQLSGRAKSFSLKSVIGQTLISRREIDGEEEIDISRLPDGVYLISVENAGARWVSKLLIQR